MRRDCLKRIDPPSVVLKRTTTPPSSSSSSSSFSSSSSSQVESFHTTGSPNATTSPASNTGSQCRKILTVTTLLVAVVVIVSSQWNSNENVLHQHQSQFQQGIQSSTSSLSLSSSSSSSSRLVNDRKNAVIVPHEDPMEVVHVNGLRGSLHHHGHNEVEHTQCRWYLAESAIPDGGLGVFTGRGLHKNDMVGVPDICIYVSDPPTHWTHLRSHSYGIGKFFGQYESKTGKSRAICEGFAITVNTVPIELVNTVIISPPVPTNAGQDRSFSPGAGSITHHYGVHGRALDTITAGSEITIDYGDWDFSEEPWKKYKKPIRPVEWLQQHGWCVDNIEIKKSTVPYAGRGAFARVQLYEGQIIAPAPLQLFENRNVFATTEPEQLFVNYCLQPSDSDMVLYPYGQAVNLINHSPTRTPNVAWKWSDNSRNHLHHKEWIDLPYDEFWKVVKPGKLIMEIYALRTIEPGEELFLDYGTEWDIAWKHHVETWKPVLSDADTKYVYPAEIDETLPLRTLKEQQTQPYPNNLITMCATPDHRRSSTKHITWYESEYMKDKWWRGMTYCHILGRFKSPSGDYYYTVSLIFDWTNITKIESTTLSSSLYYQDQNVTDNNADADTDADTNTTTATLYNSTEKKIHRQQQKAAIMDELYIDYKVPRRAIRFIEKPYFDDEHLSNAFRHPMVLPSSLTPESWKRKPTIIINMDDTDNSNMDNKESSTTISTGTSSTIRITETKSTSTSRAAK